VSDFLAQRRPHAGHLRLRRETGHAVSTLGIARVSRSDALAARRAHHVGGVAMTPRSSGRAPLGAWNARVARRDHPLAVDPLRKDLTP
jgi:hypothetical protein